METNKKIEYWKKLRELIINLYIGKYFKKDQLSYATWLTLVDVEIGRLEFLKEEKGEE